MNGPEGTPSDFDDQGTGGRTARGFRTIAAGWAPVVICLVHIGLLAWGASRHSPARDEVGHLPSGLSHWRFGTFDAYRVNPPLVRMVAALPLLVASPATDWSSFYSGLRPEWSLGLDFIEANGGRVFWYFTLARWACIPFSVLGASVCYCWARSLYGGTAGLVALVLWSFCPNVLANGQMITPDMGAAALGVAAAYGFWRWLEQPRWLPAALCGLVAGLAELSKTTWICLYFLWPLLWAIARLLGPKDGSRRRSSREAAQLLLILLLSLYVINLGYGFQGSFLRLGDYRFVSEALRGAQPTAKRPPTQEISGNRFLDTAVAALPVPLPKDYVLGIDLQKRDFEHRLPSYLGGEWKRGGWWYYYLYALTIKVPIGTWVLLVLAFVAGGRPMAIRVWLRRDLVLLSHAIIILVFVSSQTGFSHHLRYVFPAFPFLYVWVARIGRAFDHCERKLTSVAALALLWSVTSSLQAYPHSLSYFNELVGGPAGGHAHLLHSNIDWGQDLLYLRRWLNRHPEARPIRIAFEGFVPLHVAGLKSLAPPPGPVPGVDSSVEGRRSLGPQPGWYAVSVSELRGQSRRYEYFLRFRPVAMAGYSIYIYHIGVDESNRVRRVLGLLEERGMTARRLGDDHARIRATPSRSAHRAGRQEYHPAAADTRAKRADRT